MDALQAIADPTRRRIVELVAGGPQAAGEIADAFTLTRPAISQHLKALVDARVLELERFGTRRIYSLRTEELHSVRDWLGEQADRWRTALDSLETALDEGRL